MCSRKYYLAGCEGGALLRLRRPDDFPTKLTEMVNGIRKIIRATRGRERQGCEIVPPPWYSHRVSNAKRRAFWDAICRLDAPAAGRAVNRGPIGPRERVSWFEIGGELSELSQNRPHKFRPFWLTSGVNWNGKGRASAINRGGLRGFQRAGKGRTGRRRIVA